MDWELPYEEYIETRKYLGQPHEAAVHTLSTGLKLGLKPFSEYPGNEAFDAIYKKAVAENSNFKFFKHRTEQQKKNLWKAMTGQFLGLSGLYLSNDDK